MLHRPYSMAPLARVYKRDGLDHSLHCDPRYKLLLDYNAKIEKDNWGIWGIHIDYSSIPNTPEIRNPIYTLINDWNYKRMYSYLTNIMTEDEYNTYIVRYNNQRQYQEEGDKRLAAYRKKKEEEQKKNSAPSVTRTSEPRDDSSSSKDEFDRMQVISEYGW